MAAWCALLHRKRFRDSGHISSGQIRCSRGKTLDSALQLDDYFSCGSASLPCGHVQSVLFVKDPFSFKPLLSPRLNRVFGVANEEVHSSGAIPATIPPGRPWRRGRVKVWAKHRLDGQRFAESPMGVSVRGLVGIRCYLGATPVARHNAWSRLLNAARFA